MHFELRNVSQRYGDQAVLHGVSFALGEGQIGCLLGPSGSGKTTVLRCIAGFEPVSAGTIHIGGKALSEPGHTVPPQSRGVGMVFQDYALFPHLSVADNVAFGLGAVDPAARRERVTELLELVGLEELATRFPHELSGGQQQRIAIARAVAPRPAVLLLDEPFSNLDVSLRERLGSELRDILKRLSMTALLVTHDQHEAFTMADEVGVIDNGVLQQWGTPWSLYHCPANRFVAGFIGRGGWLTGTVSGVDEVTTPVATLTGSLVHDLPVGSDVDVLLRPDDLVVDPAGEVQATVTRRAFFGADVLYTLRFSGGETALSLMPSHHDHATGETVRVRFDTRHIVAFTNP